MRYDTTIYFQKLTQGEYDQETGDYKEDSVSEDSRQASIMDTTTQMMQLVYGMIKQGSLTIQLQNHYDQPFDQIRVGNTIYKADHSRKLRTKQTFYCVGGAMMSGIKVNGLDQLNAKLRKNMDLNAVKTIVKKNGADLQKKRNIMYR